MIVNALSIEKAIHELYDFTVDMLPLHGPDNMGTPLYGLFRSDKTGRDSFVAGSVRAGYCPHQAHHVASICTAAAESFPGADLDLKTTWNGGHQIVLGPSNDYRKSIISHSEGIFPRLFIDARYGGFSYTAQLGIWRDACDNLQMMRAVASGFSCKIRHTASFEGRMDDMVETFSELAAGWESLVETMQAMQAREVAMADFIREVYPVDHAASKAAQAAADRRVAQIIHRIAKERTKLGLPMGDLQTASAWEAFNAIQGHAQHDKARKGNPSRLDRALKAGDDPHVATALQLALAS